MAQTNNSDILGIDSKQFFCTTVSCVHSLCQVSFIGIDVGFTICLNLLTRKIHSPKWDIKIMTLEEEYIICHESCVMT